MKKIISIIIIFSISTSIFAQRTEHSGRNFTLTLGQVSLIPRINVQLEHDLGAHWSMGEDIKYYLEVENYWDGWVGQKLELFGRYYFSDQTIKHGGNWFMQFKGGAGLLTIPVANITSGNDVAYLGDSYDDDGNVINGVPALDPTGNLIEIYEDDVWLTYGGGVAFGYKNISCKGWVWEALAGYHYWTAPNYYTSEFESYDKTNLPQDKDFGGTRFDNLELKNWRWSIGFPIDLQFKVGKILNW